MTHTHHAAADVGSLFDRIPVAVFRTTPEGRIIAANPALIHLLGYSELSEVLAIDINTLYVDPEVRADVLARFRDGLEVNAEEFQLSRPDGRVVWARAWSRPVFENGRLVYLEGTLEDVTERRLMEQRVRTSEELFRSSFEHAPIGLAIQEPDGTLTLVNDALCKMLMLRREDLIGKASEGFVHPDDAAGMRETWAKVEAGELDSYRQDRRLLRGDGTYLDSVVYGSALRGPSGEMLGLSVQLVDLTARNVARERLAASEARFRSTFENAPIGMAVTSFDGDRLRANPALRRILGVTEQEFIALPLESFLSAPDAADARAKVKDMQEGRLNAYQVERRLTSKSGETIWAQFSVSAVRDDDGNLQTILTQVDDTTVRKQVLETLQRRERENRALVAAIPDVMFTLDREGTFLTYKPSSSVGSVAEPAEFIGKTVAEVFPRRAHQVLTAIGNVLDTREREVLEFVHGPSDAERLFDAVVTPLAEGEVLMVIREVTDRVKAQRQLEDLVRSKDELVASVSHELRTPLTTVVGMAQELHDRYDSFEERERRELLDLIVSQSTEMAELIDDLLVAARADVGMVNINSRRMMLCRETEGVLVRWTGVRPHYEAPAQPIEVWADPFRFRQILRNLLANADRYGREPVAIELGVVGSRGRLVVSDAGPGLPEERWEEIFHPYTRAHERPGVPASVGLGLTVSRQLARLMGGELTYRVDDGRSRFCLDLPTGPEVAGSASEGSVDSHGQVDHDG